MSVVNSAQSTGCSFLQTQAYSTLDRLASKAFDLALPGNLTPERLRRYQLSACGVKLLYGFERVDDEVMRALTGLAEETKAVEQMRRMQAGHVTNRLERHPSENRPVLHTAMRDLFQEKQTEEPARGAAVRAGREHEKLQNFLKRLESKPLFTDLVMIGIGGSDLGPRSLYLSLEAFGRKDRRVHFVSNVDPDDVAAVFNGLNLKQTLVGVVSKSGTTLETLTNEELARRRFVQAGLDPNAHFFSVTGEGSPMDNRNRYVECFHMWDYVGGRFSTTSMVGGVMLSFGLGYEVYREILEGAHAMDRNALEEDVRVNLPLMLALLGIWNHNFLGYPTMAIVPYSQGLIRFPAHLQQCDMESNGKRIDRWGNVTEFETGPIVWGEPGTNAQHSFFQLIHQGTSPVPVEFIGFKQSQYGEDLQVQGTTSQEKLLANLFAQALALATGKHDENPNRVFPGNRPSHILLAQQLTPKTMGALWSLYEHKIAFQGFIWGINSFDQEGVQLGKVLANNLIDHFARKRDPNHQAKSLPLGEALLAELETI